MSVFDLPISGHLPNLLVHFLATSIRPCATLPWSNRPTRHTGLLSLGERRTKMARESINLDSTKKCVICKLFGPGLITSLPPRPLHPSLADELTDKVVEMQSGIRLAYMSHWSTGLPTTHRHPSLLQLWDLQGLGRLPSSRASFVDIRNKPYKKPRGLSLSLEGKSDD